MTEKELDYFADMEVDENNLDKEVLKQPILNQRYIELFVDKQFEVNEQKRILKVKDLELKEVFARLFIKYKNEKNDGKAPSDKFAETKIYTDDLYKKKNDEIIKELQTLNMLEKQASILEGVVKSFQQRKNGLEGAITLWSQGYNGHIREKNESEDAQDRIHKKLNKGKK